MRIFYIIAGAGRMECDICLRDGALAPMLRARGHDVTFIPMYTPLPPETGIRTDQLFYGGVNVYLQQKFSIFRHTPQFIDRLFDSRWLLDFVARFGHLTQASDLAEMTISVLEGEAGRQKKELEILLEWLAGQPRPDLVVLPNSLLAGLAGPIRRALGVPVICLLSGEDAFVDEFPEPWRERARGLMRERAAEIDGFLAQSRYYARFMAEYLRIDERKIRIIIPGTDARAYEPIRRREPEVFTIGFRSPIAPTHGLHLLIEALRELKRDPRTAACRVRAAGYLGPAEKSYFKEIMGNVKAWGLEDSFEYAGDLDFIQRIDFHAGLSALAVPAIYPEPIGQFVPEAMAAGLPLVLSPAGCLPEWIEATGGGLLLDATDTISLAAALARLMRDRDLANRLGQAGRTAILQQFTLERMADSILNVFADEILARKS